MRTKFSTEEEYVQHFGELVGEWHPAPLKYRISPGDVVANIFAIPVVALISFIPLGLVFRAIGVHAPLQDPLCITVGVIWGVVCIALMMYASFVADQACVISLYENGIRYRSKSVLFEDIREFAFGDKMGFADKNFPNLTGALAPGATQARKEMSRRTFRFICEDGYEWVWKYVVAKMSKADLMDFFQQLHRRMPDQFPLESLNSMMHVIDVEGIEVSPDE